MDRRTVTIRKDIRISHFSRGSPASVIFYHDDAEPLFQIEVNPGRHSVPSEEYVSVTCSRCWFYPHFIPGVVFDSVGWTVSVLDVEGREKFQKYFGKKDFLSVDWAEDFFKDDKFGLDQFICRSILMNDADVLLPGDVLSIRCEVFYECYTNAMALRCQEAEVNNFLLRAFTPQPEARDEGCGFEFDTLSLNKTDPSTLDHPATLDRQTKLMTKEDPCFSFGEKHLGRSLRVMEESFDELAGMFDAYGKLYQLRYFTELLQRDEGKAADMWGTKKDFAQDIEKVTQIFYDLQESKNASDKNKDTGDPEESRNQTLRKVNTTLNDTENWWDEKDAVQKISLQIVRWLGLHKNLQVHFARRKWWYREEYLKENQPSQLCGVTTSTDSAGMEDEIEELFFLYKEVQNMFSAILSQKSKDSGEKKQLDTILLANVTRFFTVFLNTLRVLSLRLYWPICVLQQSSTYISKPKQKVKSAGNSECNEKEEHDNKLSVKNETSCGSKSFQNVEAQCETGLHAVQDSSETLKETMFSSNISNKNEYDASTSSKWKDSQTGTTETFDVVKNIKHDGTEICHFIIETKDGKNLAVPFQEDSTTLGWLMCTVSPVFKAMMTISMQEKINRQIRLVDIDHETLQNFIHYLQTQEVSVQSLEECSLLYAMAHEYQVPHLKIACAAHMARFLKPENADEVGEFAKFFDEDMLISLTEAYNFPWRVTITALGLQNPKINPLSSQSTWAKAAAELPANLNEVLFPKKDGDYEFYHF